MGRPLNKKWFGANANSNIKVQFNNGTVSVPGYIVRQTGSKRFECIDADGNTAICYLKDKASADLQAGEMSISVKFDNTTVDQVTKIAGRVLVANGLRRHWNFSTSTTDGYVQMEEAGTNTAMASATDLEGDDFAGDRDYPTPGSGTYVASAGITATYSAWGTPAAATGGVTTVSNSADGLYRTKWVGKMLGSPNAGPSSWDMTFPNTSYQYVASAVDTYGGFGAQPDVAPNTNFSLEWKGYIKVPTTQAWNFVFNSDDDTAMWIGNAALSPSNSNFLVYAGSGASQSVTTHATNGVILDSTKWYPVRIWFSENSGDCNSQLFAIGANGTKKNGADLTWAYNTSTKGY